MDAIFMTMLFNPESNQDEKTINSVLQAREAGSGLLVNNKFISVFLLPIKYFKKKKNPRSYCVNFLYIFVYYK